MTSTLGLCQGFLHPGPQSLYWLYRGMINHPSAKASRHNCLYSPLDTQNQEIRLLRLLPGQLGSHIVGSLTKHSLNETLKFDALSYVWGPPVFSSRITLNGFNFFITPNLSRLLNYLRLEDRERVIWVDAVCINQSDLDERSEQVTYMQKIYKQASLVRVWIDLSVDVRELAFRSLQTFSSKSNQTDIGSNVSFWVPLKSLFQHNYWSRLWVQQELIVARSITFHLQDTIFDGECIFTFLQLLYTRIYSPMNPLQDHRMWFGLGLELGILDIIPIRQLPLFHAPKKIFDLGFISLSTEDNNDSEFPLRLLDLLHFSRKLEVSDPRDRVYGLMQIAKDADKLALSISYRITTAEVFTQVAIRIYEISQLLELMCYVRLSSSPRHALPTWAPDWDFSDPQNSWLPTEYAAAANVQQQDRIQISPNMKLLLKGFKVADIAFVEQPETEKTIRWHMVSWFDMAKKSLQLFPPDKMPADSQIGDYFTFFITKMLHLILKSGTRHSPFSSDYTKEEAGGLFFALFELSKIGGEYADHSLSAFHDTQIFQILDPGVRRGLQRLWECINCRSVCILSTGIPILAPEDTTEIGDELWILFGSPMPIILRPFKGGYRAVAAAFDDNIMRGEHLARLLGQEINEVVKGGLSSRHSSQLYRRASSIEIQ